MKPFNLFKILLPTKNIGQRILKPEQNECIQFANYLRFQSMEKDFPYIWFHVPNEFSKYNGVFGIKMAWMGRVPGVADYCFVGPEDSFFIEFKRKNTKQSAGQQIFEEWCKDRKVEYYIFRDHQKAIEFLEKRINDKKEAKDTRAA